MAETTTLGQEVFDLLSNKFGKAALSLEQHYDFPVITIDKKAVADVVKHLYDNGYQYLTTCCGLHYPDSKGKELGMMYQLHDLKNNKRIRLKAFTAVSDPVFPSLTGVFAAANWMEREAYDFYGLHFTGHPNLKRILNIDTLEGWPLRKEYPLEDPTREDKDDKMFGR